MASATAPARYRYRPRVVARGRSGGRATRIRWDRLGRVVLVLVLFAILLSYIGPIHHVVDSWREANAGEARLAEVKAENDRLTRQAKGLEKSAATIAEARKLGLVAPGEQAYVVDGVK